MVTVLFVYFFIRSYCRHADQTEPKVLGETDSREIGNKKTARRRRSFRRVSRGETRRNFVCFSFPPRTPLTPNGNNYKKNIVLLLFRVSTITLPRRPNRYCRIMGNDALDMGVELRRREPVNPRVNDTVGLGKVFFDFFDRKK